MPGEMPAEKGWERRFPIAKLLTDKLVDEDWAIGNRPSFEECFYLTGKANGASELNAYWKSVRASEMPSPEKLRLSSRVRQRSK